MTDVLLVTGGTGLAGSTIALKAAEQGRRVRALVRSDHDVGPLQAGGVEIAIGDLTDTDSLRAAMEGVSGVINAAAALGGKTDDLEQLMWDVNHDGALNVLDVAREMGVRRCVHMDSNSIWDAEHSLTERSPLIAIGRWDTAYVSAKRAAFAGAMHRALCGQDIVFVTPGAIYGPGPIPARVLDHSSFTALILSGIRGEIETYVKFPFPWTFVEDLAEVSLAALDRGARARRYLALGSDDDASSVASMCNDAAEIAGSPHRIRDLDPDDPEAPDIGTRRQFVERTYGSPLIDPSWTNEQLGLHPTPRREALATTIAWLRERNELPQSPVIAG